MFVVCMPVDGLEVTKDIWRKWEEKKIIPPMTWQELRLKVEEYIREGKDPYDILRGEPPTEEWIERRLGKPRTEEERRERHKERYGTEELPPRGYPHTRAGRYVETRLPWPNPEPEVIVTEAELPSFSRSFLGKVKEAWKTKTSQRFWEWLIEPTEKGVLVGLRGAERPRQLFSDRLIESKKFDDVLYGKTATFYFESREDRKRAAEILAKHNFYFPYGPDISLTEIDEPDYMLELLASEGFDTSKILVERG